MLSSIGYPQPVLQAVLGDGVYQGWWVEQYLENSTVDGKEMIVKFTTDAIFASLTQDPTPRHSPP